MVLLAKIRLERWCERRIQGMDHTEFYLAYADQPIRVSSVWVERGVLRDALVAVPAGWASWLSWQIISILSWRSQVWVPQKSFFLLHLKMLLFRFITRFACPRLTYPLCLSLSTDCIVAQADPCNVIASINITWSHRTITTTFYLVHKWWLIHYHLLHTYVYSSSSFTFFFITDTPISIWTVSHTRGIARVVVCRMRCNE